MSDNYSFKCWFDGSFNGDFFDGIWKKGIFQNGLFTRSRWLDGVFEDGVFFNSSFSKGIFRQGAIENSTFVGGTIEQCKAENSSIRNVVIDNGNYHGGSIEHSKIINGIFKNVIIRASEFYNGTFDGGFIRDSVWKDGIWISGNWDKTNEWIKGKIYSPEVNKEFEEKIGVIREGDYVISLMSPNIYNNKLEAFKRGAENNTVYEPQGLYSNTTNSINLDDYAYKKALSDYYNYNLYNYAYTKYGIGFLDTSGELVMSNNSTNNETILPVTPAVREIYEA